MDVFEDDLQFAVSMYTAEQVRPHAEACLSGRCTSFIHCFYGRPRKDAGVPMPVCARSILRLLEPREGVK